MSNFMAAGMVRYSMEDQGVVFIEGANADRNSRDSNGSGKSTIFVEALSWVLFDTTLRGISKDRVVGTLEGGTEVGVRLLVDGKSVQIRRYRRHSDNGNSLRMWVDEEEVTCHTVKDTQVLVERTIQVTEEIFFRTTVLGQGLTHRFSDLGDNERKQMLETIIGSSIFEAARQRAVQHNTKLRNDIARVEGSIDANTRSVESVRVELEEAKRASAEFEYNKGNNIARRVTELEMSQHALKELDLDAKEAEYAVLLEQVQGFEVRLQSGIDKKATLTAERGPLQRAYQEQIGKVNGVPESVCPTCTREIKAEDRNKIVADWEAEAKKKLVEIEVIDTAISTINATAGDVNAEREKWGKENSWHTWINPTDPTSIVALRQRHQQLGIDVTTKQQALTAAEAQVDPHEKNIESLKARIESTTELLDAEHKELLNLASQASLAKFWNGGFTTLRAMSLEQTIGYLNERLHGYIEVLSEGELEISLALIRKGKTEQIGFDCGGREYASLSGGEKRRMDLSMALALHDLATRSSGFECNILVADEVADSLDTTGVDRFVQFLHEMEVPSVFVISHNPHLRSRIGKHWTVRKENKVSTLSV
jgi:DNA repair exonuclease SbcCD ATPase subunit